MQQNNKLKTSLEKDGLFKKNGTLNSAWIHNRSKNYDFSSLEGNTLQEKLYLLYHKKTCCAICGRETPFISFNKGYQITCSKECKRIYDTQTLRKASSKLKEKETKEKRKNTCIEKYGVSNPFKSLTIKEKIKQTSLKKYGVKKPSQSEEIKNKIKQTNLQNHNRKWSTQDPEHWIKIKEKIQEAITQFERENHCVQKEKLIQQYGQGWLRLNLPQIYDKKYVFIEEKYIPRIEKHYQESIEHDNHAEKEIYEFCKSLLPEIEIIRNNRSIIKGTKDRNLELDIYIPSKNVAIEFNGIFWHSKTDKDYHLYKTKECEKQGIRLIHVWEDLWKNKKEIYKSIIASALGIYSQKIYARDCEYKKINSKECESFLEKNHLQGAIKSSLALGLFYKGELVQVACWGKSRFKKNEYELYRMCSKINTQVVGGFSKLIKHSELKEFISYVDRDLYNGYGYKFSGFKILGYTNPGYFYSDGKSLRINRISAQKHKLAKILKDFDASLTESENMQKNGFYKIYNCGNIKVIYSEA